MLTGPLNLTAISMRRFGRRTHVGTEGRLAREARMRNFWAAPENRWLFRIGKLLENDVEGVSLAQRLAQGEEIELNSITVADQYLPLQPRLTLSLNSLSEWGCPACHSAHGSGVAPSRNISADELAKNEFYYNPATERLFTISKTCFKKYVEALGARTDRFVDPPFPREIPNRATGLANSAVTGRTEAGVSVEKIMPRVSIDAEGGPPKSPLNPSDLRRMADSGQCATVLQRQARVALPDLLRKLEAYVRACAAQGYRSTLIMCGDGPPCSLDQVRCIEAIEAAAALQSYLYKYKRVVGADNLRGQVADHFHNLGFQARLIRDPRQTSYLHLRWLFEWFLPRDTVEVVW
jgi:hypothetical protein